MNADHSAEALLEPRRSALRQLVIDEARSRAASRTPRRIRRLTAGVVGAAVLGGGGVLAYAQLASPGVTDTTSVRCYQSANVNSNYTQFSRDDGAGGPPSHMTDAVAACGRLYREGLLPAMFTGKHPGKVTLATNDPVPPLVACVWPTGIAAVFPAPVTCARLGLPADLPTKSKGHR